MAVVLLGEALQRPILMLLITAGQVVGHSDVENIFVSVGHDVNSI